MASKLRVIIADDHPIYRGGLRQVIESRSEYEVVAEADHGESALAMIREFRPDIAILDVGMPKLDGLAVARAVLAESLPIRIIFLTMYREARLFELAIEAGVMGYVLKESAAVDLLSCVKAVAAGEHYTSPAITSYLVKRKQHRQPASEQNGIDILTETERRVLRLLAECKTSKQIAEALFVSRRTIDHHRANIGTKLNLHGSHALMKFALQNKELFNK